MSAFGKIDMTGSRRLRPPLPAVVPGAGVHPEGIRGDRVTKKDALTRLPWGAAAAPSSVSVAILYHIDPDLST
jgi:hypothetical protein